MLKLSLTALEIFRQVALEGSILGAASRLNRVQSNVSTRVKQLEERLGTVLFHRDRRGLTLTDDGHVLLKYAERLLSLSEEAEDALEAAVPMGMFRIGTMESTAASRLPEILSCYHARFPEVEIHIETDTAGGLIQRLNSKEIDAAFIAEPVSVDGLASEPVFLEELMLVAPATFAAMTKDHLDGETIVAFEEGCAYRRYLNDWLSENGIHPRGTISVGSYLAILACVAAGTGFAVVPRSVLDTITTNGEFKIEKLPGRYARIKTLLVWRDGYVSPKLKALRKLLPRVR
jgi:DNA-binding transcriptional LysR family regulator